MGSETWKLGKLARVLGIREAVSRFTGLQDVQSSACPTVDEQAVQATMTACEKEQSPSRNRKP